MRAPFSRTLFDLIEEQAQRSPEAIAVHFEERRLTFAQLVQRARQVAAGLASKGIKRGDRVGLLMPNSVEWLETSFGAHALGAVVVPFSTWVRASELDSLLRDSQVDLLVTVERVGDQDYAALLTELIPDLPHARGRLHSSAYPSLRDIVVLGHQGICGALDYEQLTGMPPIGDLPPGVGARPDDDAFVIYTSGSSGVPKAIRLQHFAAIENAFNIGERQGYSPGDCVFVTPSLFWTYACVNALPAAFTHGASIVLQRKFDAGDVIRLVERHGCTAIYTLPSITTAILRHPDFSKEAVASLRTGLTIGSPEDVRKVAEDLGIAEICNIYGASETYGNCCVTHHDWPLAERMQTQGEPLPGVEVRIVDPESGQPLQPGTAGLVEVRGYNTPGYAGASAVENEKAFTANGFFRTGDMGQMTKDGRFVFVGRTTEMIKRSGINVSPAEVEDVILRHRDVAQVGVTALPDEERDQIIVAFVVPKHGVQLVAQEIIAHCKASASRYKVPDLVHFTAALPVTSTGKLLRRELRAQAETITDRDNA